MNDGEFNVYIGQDSVFEVSIEAESNLVPYIRTRVNGTTLHIDTRENLRDHLRIGKHVRYGNGIPGGHYQRKRLNLLLW